MERIGQPQASQPHSLIASQSPWRVSIHGGHSGAYCDHGQGTLREILEAAAEYGYHTFGVAEHAPRFDARYLYPEEIAMGWDVAKITRDFERYAVELRSLSEEFEGRMTVLCGFEAEVVPPDRYPEVMADLRRRHGFDYVVGSVHWVDDVITDYTQEEFDRAVALHGGIEPLAIRYYEIVGEMAAALQPEVVGHLDVIRKFVAPQDKVDTPAIRCAAARALEAIRDIGCILDVNTAALRKGSSVPYPAPWLVQMAAERFGIPFCFGDDSHAPAQVGMGIPESRAYLLENGVASITFLTRQDGAVVRQTASLL